MKYPSKLKRNSKFNRYTERGASYYVQEQNPKAVYRQCGKKYAYYTEALARKCAARAAQLRGVSLRVYQCPICQKFHLTSQ